MKQLIVLCVLLGTVFAINKLERALIPPKSTIVQHRPAQYGDNGIWKKHTEWKARWVKEWHVKKLLVPVWRKVWGPIEINEWVPLPQVPSNWHEAENRVNLT